jgi:AraC family transcriptional regulator of adaptative response/methylated-DNA-[protein]-cysteine methyltransferase
MQRARQRRDSGYDGVFWVCVKTTGIFCRPSCPARSPYEAHVHYAFSVDDARRGGFRPCRRCRPTATDGQPESVVQSLLALSAERRTERLLDADLRAAGIDPVLARRRFRKAFGMTFHAYHRAARLGRAMNGLAQGSGILHAGLAHGYESDSGFREAFARKFRTSPGRSHKVETVFASTMPSPLGELLLGASARGICLLDFHDGNDKPAEFAAAERRIGAPIVPGTHAYIDQMRSELEEYFAGHRRDFSVPLDIRGTDFQKDVWRKMLKIPYGKTLSYGGLAERVGRPSASRAVGQASGANRIGIVIPCHRVVQSNGLLRGYGGGLWRKQFLLELEGAVVPDAALLTE